MALISPPALDKPLPEEVVATSGNWLVRYRMYPVFSGLWFLGRLRLSGTIIAVLLLLSFASFFARRSELAMSTLGLALVLNIAVLAMLTSFAPLMAYLVRSRGWPFQRESRAIVVVVVLGLIASVVVYQNTGEYITELVERPAEKTLRLQRLAEVAAKPLPVRVGLKAIEWSIFFAQAAALGGGLALVAYFRERDRLKAFARKQELAAEQAARHEAELRLSVLQAQIEPHFLFNTLAGLRSLISHDPPRAIDMTDKLVDYLRATMPRMRGDGSAEGTTLGQQLDAVKSYLELMQIRMDDRLQFSIELDPAVRDAPFPALMLVTLVENSIKHGLEPLAKGGMLQIRAEAAGAEVRVAVADNGVGFGNSTTSGTGVGLANIRMRLQQMYGERARLELLTKPLDGQASGFTAVIHLPKEA
jgi:hypothetical protein